MKLAAPQLILGIFLLSSPAFALYNCNQAGDGCSGSLNCVDPITRMDCTDNYCFYPPKDTMSQARCCENFGNMGDAFNQDTDVFLEN